MIINPAYVVAMLTMSQSFCNVDGMFIEGGFGGETFFVVVKFGRRVQLGLDFGCFIWIASTGVIVYVPDMSLGSVLADC